MTAENKKYDARRAPLQKIRTRASYVLDTIFERGNFAQVWPLIPLRDKPGRAPDFHARIAISPQPILHCGARDRKILSANAARRCRLSGISSRAHSSSIY